MPSAQEKVNIWYGANGSPIEQRTYPEAASQTFKRGDLVYLSSGKVTEAVAAGSDVAAGTKLLGVALKDASGATDEDVPVALANPHLRVVLPVMADDASATTAVTDVGVAYGLRRNAAGKWSVNKSETVDTKCVVTAIHPQHLVGEAYGWVEIRFLDAQVDVAA